MTDAHSTSNAAAHDEKYIATPRQVALTLAVIVILLAAVAGAVALFGWPVLGLVALACVPVVFLCLILLTRGG